MDGENWRQRQRGSPSIGQAENRCANERHPDVVVWSRIPRDGLGLLGAMADYCCSYSHCLVYGLLFTKGLVGHQGKKPRPIKVRMTTPRAVCAPPSFPRSTCEMNRPACLVAGGHVEQMWKK